MMQFSEIVCLSWSWSKQNLTLHIKVRFGSAKDHSWFLTQFHQCHLWDTLNIKWQGRITVQVLEFSQFTILDTMCRMLHNTIENRWKKAIHAAATWWSKIGRTQTRPRRNALRALWITASVNDKTQLSTARKQLFLWMQ